MKAEFLCNVQLTCRTLIEILIDLLLSASGGTILTIPYFTDIEKFYELNQLIFQTDIDRWIIRFPLKNNFVALLYDDFRGERNLVDCVTVFFRLCDLILSSIA